MLLLLFFIIILIGAGGGIASYMLKSKFKKYSQTPFGNGMSGKEVAEKMLHDNGIYDVSVHEIEGTLSDFFNPENKTVNLSRDVYNGTSVASAAVAAHECGHAVQHARAYAPLKVRSLLVPPINFCSRYVTWILLAGIFMVQTFPILLEIGIAMFALTTIFSFVTLPVEINASQRAMAWINQSGLTDQKGHDQAKDALTWAAYTYVIAALGSLMTLLYYVAIALSGERR